MIPAMPDGMTCSLNRPNATRLALLLPPEKLKETLSSILNAVLRRIVHFSMVFLSSSLPRCVLSESEKNGVYRRGFSNRILADL